MHPGKYLFQTSRFFLLCSLLFGGRFAVAQEVQLINSAQINQWKNTTGDTVYVINFWATWCAPCVAELPAFEKIQQQYAGQKVQVILVSTDFKKDLETRVKPFVLEKNLHSRVAFMNETNPNNWIDLVHGDWSGLIPATLLVGPKHFEYFFEGPLDYETLEAAVKEALH